MGAAKARRQRSTPTYAGLAASSPRASAAARGSSKKKGTKCELALRRRLWRIGLRYRVDVATLPGRPDVAFPKARLAVFCDGDFWHGRDLEARVAKLGAGHNSAYWVAKIRRNVARDRARDAALQALGWRVLRLWETDILRNPDAAGAEVLDALEKRRNL